MNIRRRRRSQNIDAIVNVTSLIDVTFILLIFFMITTTFAKPNKQLPMITLPQATNVENQKKQADIEVIIDEKGNYYINGEQLMTNDISSLSRALEKEKLKINKEDAYVSVKGDEKVTYQYVINVFDTIKNLDMGVAPAFPENSLIVSKLVNLLELEKKKFSKTELTIAVGIDANSSITNFANIIRAVELSDFQKLTLSHFDKRKEK
jgi:biopolymer transport protein ExbD